MDFLTFYFLFLFLESSEWKYLHLKYIKLFLRHWCLLTILSIILFSLKICIFQLNQFEIHLEIFFCTLFTHLCQDEWSVWNKEAQFTQLEKMKYIIVIESHLLEFFWMIRAESVFFTDIIPVFVDWCQFSLCSYDCSVQQPGTHFCSTHGVM